MVYLQGLFVLEEILLMQHLHRQKSDNVCLPKNPGWISFHYRIVSEHFFSDPMQRFEDLQGGIVVRTTDLERNN
jgi:hypothetical protein